MAQFGQIYSCFQGDKLVGSRQSQISNPVFDFDSETEF